MKSGDVDGHPGSHRLGLSPTKPGRFRGVRDYARGFGELLFLVVRGVLLWFFLVPSLLAWFVAVVAWALLRPFGFRVPVSQLYYSRWATYLLDAILSRIRPGWRSPWPWQVAVRQSRIRSWSDAFDWPFN